MGASTLQQVINYVTPGNFTFDSGLIEFTGTLARLKDLIPANALFHTKFDTKDGTWGSGVLTGTLSGNATVSGGVLNLSAGSAGRVEYDGALNMPSGNTGCVRFTMTPGYSGSGTWMWFSSSQAESNINNLVRIQQISGLIRVDIYNNAGVSLLTSQTGNGFNPVAGTPYEIELNWDGTNAWLFVNGVLTGGVKTMTAGTQGARGIMRLGDNYTSTPTNPLNATMDNLVVFDAVQHTADYTPFQAIPFQYSKDGPSIINNSGVTGDALDDLEETTVTVPANTDIQYIINVNAQDKYWDGDSWEDSDGSLAQSNTLEVVLANKASLDLALGATIKIKALLVSTDGSSRPEIETVTLGYNFFNTQNQPATCTVWGFYRDVRGLGVAGATVSFSLKRSSKQYREAGDAIIEKTYSVVTDVNGRFEADLVRSSEYEIDGEYEITIVDEDNSLDTSIKNANADPIRFTVPDLADVNITDLITAEL